MSPKTHQEAALGAVRREVLEDPQVERVRINFSWILKLRWAAVVGQLATVMAVALGLGIELPLLPLGAVVLLEALSNLILELWFRNKLRCGSWEGSYRRGDAILGWVMVGDIGLLTVLLSLTGGPSNPFSIFYLVNVVLAAVVLRSVWAWGVVSCALAGCLSTFAFHHRLPELAVWDSVAGDVGSVPIEDDVQLYFRGLLVAFSAACLIVGYFVTRVTGGLRERERELNDARHKRSRSERIEALATLAAGAAHELASPLSTIAVVAKELEILLNQRERGEGVIADVHLIRDEVARCRSILDQMSIDVGLSRVERMTRHSLPEILDTAVEGLKHTESLERKLADELLERRFLVPKRTVALALRGVIENALDASPAGSKVEVIAGLSREELEVSVRDCGAGMGPEVLERATDPFFTTKEPGQGMGLGLFLARTVIDRLGGGLVFDSERGRGTTARISIPLARLSPEPILES